MNKTQLRRISAIVKVLNTGETMKQEVLRLKVIDLIDRDFCKSTLEKDIQYLKMEFDLELIHCGIYGVKLREPIDFLERLRLHLNLF
jgi:hypothetical protein